MRKIDIERKGVYRCGCMSKEVSVSACVCYRANGASQTLVSV